MVFTTNRLCYKLMPLANRVLIRKIETAKETDGGIVLPDTVKQNVKKGTVLAVGPGHVSDEGKLIPVTLKPGDTVIFPDLGGTKVEHEGEDCLLMKEHEIWARC